MQKSIHTKQLFYVKTYLQCVPSNDVFEQTWPHKSYMNVALIRNGVMKCAVTIEFSVKRLHNKVDIHENLFDLD